jgi:LmbE family N-acetylglucosaminyl deacetylase
VGYEQIAGLGTAEAAWQSWPGLVALPPVDPADLVPPGGRLVLAAPHPDDEVLAAGGLLALLHAAGRDLLLVAVTDGTASHPGSTRWSPDRLRGTRPLETREALRRLGLGHVPEVGLGLPDGDVGAHDQALAERLGDLLSGRDVLAATWRGDGHPDHEAVGQAAARAAAAAGVPLLELPVWTWHWADPGDRRVPWHRAVRVPLDADTQARKRHAVAAYVSQLEHDPALVLGSVLPERVLDRLLRPFEVLFLSEGLVRGGSARERGSPVA